MRARAGATDHGSAGLLAVWVAVLVLMAGSSATVWGAALAARHRAARTADLAALAAAAAAVRGTADPCTAAGRVTETVRADLATCAVLADGSVLVVVALRWRPGGSGPWGALRLPPARARARAGVPS